MRAKLGVLTALGMAIMLFVSVAAEADSGRRGHREHRGPDYSQDHQRHHHRDARRHHYRDHRGYRQHYRHHQRRHTRRHHYGHHRPYYGYYGRPHYRHGYRHHRRGHRHGHRQHRYGHRYYPGYGVPSIVFRFPDRISHRSTQEGAAVGGRDIVWNEPRYEDQTDRQEIRWVDGNSEGYCREFQSVSVVAGRDQITYGRACRQPDGSWQIVH